MPMRPWSAPSCQASHQLHHTHNDCGIPDRSSHRQNHPESRRHGGTMAEPESQISDSDLMRLRALAEDFAVEDFSYALSDMEKALLLAVEATKRLVDEWDEEGLGCDEFSVPRETVESMSDRQRLIYVGQLVHTVCLRYGLGHGDPKAVLEAAPSSPAQLLRGLNDLLYLPST